MKFGPKNETENYQKVRAELLSAEVALRDQCERVAELRRKLPVETPVEDYVLHEGPASLDEDGPVSEVRLSQLFKDPAKTLVVYQYMYGGAQKTPCPMCTLWVDGFNGVGQHIQDRLNFAIIGQAPIDDLRKVARGRDWRKLRVISADGTNFKTDLGFAEPSGAQWPGMSVFTRSADGSLKHFYSGSAFLNEGNIYRGIDMLTPLWNMLDLTPEGRGNHMPKLEYTLANVQKH